MFVEKTKKKFLIKPEFIVLFFGALLLCCFFPYTGDDWAWGSQIGLDRLSNWFDNYSGRYFGNLIVLALTRSYILRNIVVALTVTGIVYIPYKLTGSSKIGFSLLVSSIVFLPIPIFRQSLTWTAGFANYATSIFLTLIFIYYIKDIFSDTPPKYHWLHCIPCLLLGFANTLIVEHFTVYNLLLGLAVCVFTVIKFKKLYIQHVSYFIGTVLGTLTMFSNSVYRSVAEGTDGYREIANEGGIIQKAINNYFTTIMTEGFLNNVWINVLLAIVCVAVWYKLKEKATKKVRLVASLSLCVIIAYTALSVMSGLNPVTYTTIAKYCVAAATALFVAALGIFLLTLPVGKNDKQHLIFIYLSIGVTIAPLLVVSPIGSRCFFGSYVFFAYLIGKLLHCIEFDHKAVARGILVACAAGFIYLSCIYCTIFVTDVNRVQKAREEVAAGSVSIKVKALPYGDYVWCGNPTQGTVWETRFKLFYDIDEDVQITVVSNNKK